MTRDDATALASLVRLCRDLGSRHAFPAPDDVASLLAHPQAAKFGAVWWDGAEAVAWVQTQPDFGNVLFEISPAVRDGDLPVTALQWGLEQLRSVGSSGADTPVESDDSWRAALLATQSFIASGESVVHLHRHDMSQLPRVEIPEGMRLRPLDGDVDAYVTAHRAAFGTTYLTSEVRRAWEDDPGYEPAYDLVLVEGDGAVMAFSVSYLVADHGEIGTVGVVPAYKGNLLSHVMVAAALQRLADGGAQTAGMSTARDNAPMLATAGWAGFSEVRRTQWWHRDRA